MKCNFFSNKIIALVFMVFLSITLVNCNQSNKESTSFDLEKATSEIRSRLNVYEESMTKGDINALGKMYTEDAEIFQDGKANTKGRENITEVFEGWAKNNIIGKFTTTGLWGNKDLLVEQGTGYFEQTKGEWKSSGKYLLVWKKVAGEWKIFRDTWFSDPKVEE